MHNCHTTRKFENTSLCLCKYNNDYPMCTNVWSPHNTCQGAAIIVIVSTPGLYMHNYHTSRTIEQNTVMFVSTRSCLSNVHNCVEPALYLLVCIDLVDQALPASMCTTTTHPALLKIHDCVCLNNCIFIQCAHMHGARTVHAKVHKSL